MPEEKQLTWNGEGLPPVGTICELTKLQQLIADNDVFAWFPEGTTVEILAHANFGGGAEDVAFYRVERLFYSGSGIASLFRPIRTPEQIAAEEREKEREKELEAMFRIYRDAGQFRAGLSALYDAGYRKQEGKV